MSERTTSLRYRILKVDAVSGVPVHTLKAAIYVGVIPGTGALGRCSLKHVDPDEW